MQSKDIIFQVSEETAGVMEEISNQLFDETESRFDEVMETIEEAVRKIENFYSESDKKNSSNQTELIGKFSTILEAISIVKKDAQDQAVLSRQKSDLLHAIIADVPELIKAVSLNISESSETAKTFQASLLQTATEISKSLIELHQVQSNIAETLDSDDSREMLASALKKLSELEKEVLQSHDSLTKVCDAIHNCNTSIETIINSTNDLQENDKRILYASGKAIQMIAKVGQQSEDNSETLEEKLEDVIHRLNILTNSIQAISDKQNEICEKQIDLQKDVSYLKLPFFKKWFTKG